MGLFWSALGTQRRTGPPRSHSSSKWPNSLRSSKPLTSLSGSKLKDLALSSQNGVPVSGLKCQRTTSRTWASSCSRAWRALSAEGVVLMRAKLLRTGSTRNHATSFRTPRCLLPCDGEQVLVRHQVQHAVGDDWRGLDALLHVHLVQQLLLLAVGENMHVAAVVRHVHLTVHPQRRRPYRRLQVFFPQVL